MWHILVYDVKSVLNNHSSEWCLYSDIMCSAIYMLLWYFWNELTLDLEPRGFIRYQYFDKMFGANKCHSEAKQNVPRNFTSLINWVKDSWATSWANTWQKPLGGSATISFANRWAGINQVADEYHLNITEELVADTYFCVCSSWVWMMTKV